MSVLCNYILRIVDVLLYKVAQSNNLAALDVHHAVHSALCAHAEPHESNPYTLDWFASQLQGAVIFVVAFFHCFLFAFAK